MQTHIYDCEEENVNVDDVNPEPNNPTDDSVENKAEEEKTNTSFVI